MHNLFCMLILNFHFQLLKVQLFVTATRYQFCISDFLNPEFLFVRTRMQQQWLRALNPQKHLQIYFLLRDAQQLKLSRYTRYIDEHRGWGGNGVLQDPPTPGK
jgi:hypothetical protein